MPMNLREYQQRVMRVSLAQAPDVADLAALQEQRAFSLYRHMIRTRLVGMAKVAFKQSCSESGEAAFEASFWRYLAERPPRSPMIRDVVADFGPFAAQDPALLSAAPELLGDLLAFEEHKWRIGYAAGVYAQPGEDGVRELDFEGRPVWNFSLRILSQRFAVHLAERSGEPCEGELLMYRPPHTEEVRWYQADGFFTALVRRSHAHAETLAELVQRVAEQRGVTLDASLLETLATSLTLALERGVLLGVR
jgi:hypothetical protein